jgi:hypothetical protein
VIFEKLLANVCLQLYTLILGLVGVRAPISKPQGAEKLCLKFSGGGRAAAAGINHLIPDDVDRFFDAFEKQFAN